MTLLYEANAHAKGGDSEMTRDEYYAALEERHKQVDWTNRESVRAYNEYVRELRSQMEADDD